MGQKSSSMKQNAKYDSRLGWVMKEDKKVDLVNHPPHYKYGNMEILDIIKEKSKNTHMNHYEFGIWGQMIQYLFRFDLKGSWITDLKKARFYLDALIREEENKK